MKMRIVRETPIIETARVAQIAGMFDVPPAEKSRVELNIDLPLDERQWNVGLIVGPSGAGKSSVARECFGEGLIAGFEWPRDQSMLDGFPECSIKEIVKTLNAVGFGSVPNWLRPFHVLSNGEQFRATIARALTETQGLVVIDEFTSVVDRQVAKVASYCIQKTIRRSHRQFVAVSCHYDIVEWLQPDWVYEPHLEAFEWRSLQRRPALIVEIRSVRRDVWYARFSHHHYLSALLHNSAVCIGGFAGDQCIAFCSATPFPHPVARNIWTEHRTVVLPEYQGLGLGGILAEWLGTHLWERGYRFHSTPSHPAIIRQKAASPRWRMLRYGLGNSSGTKGGPKRGGLGNHQRRRSMQRVSASFAFSAPAGTPSPRRPERTGPLLGRDAD